MSRDNSYYKHKYRELLKAVEDIKAEIEHIADYTYGSTNYDADLYNGAYKDGLYEAIDVIDKHISGKEQK